MNEWTPNPHLQLLWIFSYVPPPLCAVVLTPHVPTAWALKADSWGSPWVPAYHPCLKVHEQERKQEDFSSFLSSTKPQHFPWWCHYKNCLWTLYTHVILFCIGLVYGTIKVISKLYDSSQCGPCSCSGVKEVNYHCVAVTRGFGSLAVLWKSPKEKQPPYLTVSSQAHWNVK